MLAFGSAKPTHCGDGVGLDLVKLAVAAPRGACGVLPWPAAGFWLEHCGSDGWRPHTVVALCIVGAEGTCGRPIPAS